MRHPDEPELTEEDKQAIEAIRRELDRELGPWPEVAASTSAELAPPARSSAVATSSARPSRALRLGLGAGITTLAAAVVAAVVSLVDVGALIAPPRSASLHRSAPAPPPAPPSLSDTDPTPMEPSVVAAPTAVDRDPGVAPRLTQRARPVSRGGDGEYAGRSTGAPSYRRPIGAEPARADHTLTTRYRTERAPQAARSPERVGHVQAP